MMVFFKYLSLILIVVCLSVVGSCVHDLQSTENQNIHTYIRILNFMLLAGANLFNYWSFCNLIKNEERMKVLFQEAKDVANELHDRR